jgi:DHA1 family multidrug resistance protein-like MFS transporter
MVSRLGEEVNLLQRMMFGALGVGGGGSLIAGVACLLAPIPFVFYRYGESIRRSKFAPTEDNGEKEKEHGDRGRDEEEGVVGRNAESESTGVGQAL